MSTDSLLSLKGRINPGPHPLPPGADLITSPLQAQVWQVLLQDHPDRSLVDFVISGIQEGFHIVFNYPSSLCHSAKRNMFSSREHPAVVSQYIASERHMKRMHGPFSSSCNIHTSPIGVIPKKHREGKWRLIVDLSSPEGSSVNDGIDPSLCSMSYITVQDAIHEITKLGKGALLAKLDIKDAYRMVPVHPTDRHLLGIQWQGATYIDGVLPFGLRSAPKIFNSIADLLQWIIIDHCHIFVIHYLDDFLLIGPPRSSHCMKALDKTLAICQRLGIPIAPEKVEGPSTQLTFLGVQLDTMSWEARLPHDKLVRIHSMVKQWKGRSSGKAKELESLLGYLQDAARVVTSGKTFTRRIIDLLRLPSASAPSGHIRLNRGFRSDIEWRCRFLPSWNGVSLLPPTHYAPHAVVTSDASGNWGCGAYSSCSWFQFCWPVHWSTVDIAAKELLPIVMALTIWGKQWSGSCVLIRCDNLAVVHILRSGYAKNEDAMHLMRCLFFITASFSLSILSQHLPGCHNQAADALSRDRLPLFHSLVPQASLSPSPIPLTLVELLVSLRPDWTDNSWTTRFLSILQRV